MPGYQTSTLGFQILGTTGEWIVCWPSLYNDHSEFLLFAIILARDHRVLIIDSPGMGFSKNHPSPLLGSLELSTMGTKVIDQEIAGEPFHFVGHGIGGHIDLEIASKYPELKTLTLSGTPLMNELNLKPFMSPFFKYPFANFLGSFFLKFGLSTRLVKWMLIKHYSVAPRDYVLVESTVKSILKTANGRVLVTLPHPTQFTIEHHKLILSKINQPILIIAGIHDKISLPIEQLQSSILAKNGTYVEVDSGFMTYLTAASDCADHWLEHKKTAAEKPLFLNRIKNQSKLNTGVDSAV